MLNYAQAALRLLSRSARNLVLDARYGKVLSFDPQHWRKGLVKKESPSLFDIGNADYMALERIFKGRIKETDVVVDVGCRKARLFSWCLQRGLNNRLIGVELDEEIAEKTRRRLSKFPNVTIITGDIVTNIPQDGTLFYLYNPFGKDVVAAFNGPLKELAATNPDVRVIYYNPQHLDVFVNDPDWAVEMLKIDDAPVLPFAEVALITQSRLASPT